MNAPDFGRVADIYDATRSLPDRDMLAILDAVAKVVPDGGRIIDVGVGTGRFAKPLHARGYDVVGIDISKGMMAKARQKGYDRLVLADVQRIPFRNQAFGSALLVHVLHVVREWTAVVEEAARVSRGAVVSVIDVNEVGGRHAIRGEYREIRLKMGHPLDRFEKGEGGLLERVVPDMLIPVVETEREADADDEIRHLELRGQSITWDVPDEVHGRIIAELKKNHGGTKLRWKSKVDVAVWSSGRLRREKLARSQKG